MKGKEPVRVSNISDEKVRRVKGTHLGKLCKAGIEVQVELTCIEWTPEVGDVRHELPYAASGNIPVHLSELIATSSKSMTIYHIPRPAL